MNYELLQERMHKFFQETTPDEIVSKFEALGYVFVDSKYKYNQLQVYEKVGILGLKERSNWLENILNQNNRKNLDKFGGFFCKLVVC